jgi:hypothetical protein
MKGGRSAATFQSTLTATSGNASLGVQPFYTVANFWLTMNATDGGTAPTLFGGVGEAIAINPQTILAAGATNYLEMSTGEINMAAVAGSSVARKFDIKIVPLAADAVQGSVADAAIKFGGAGTAGRKNGLLFGGDISGWQWRGNIIKAEYSTAQSTIPNTSNWFADMLEDAFPAFSVNGGLIRSQGFAVGGDGVTQIGTALLSPTATGISIDAPGSVETATTLNNGGAACAAGDILSFGNNGRAIVNTVTGTAVATYSVLNPPYDFSGAPPATLAATAFASSAGPCSGVVLNVTWAARDGVMIAGVGRKAGFFGTAPVAKPVGVAVTAAGIHAALTALGIIAP